MLFRILQAAIDSQALSSVGIGNERIHTLQFADDLLIFFDGSFRSVKVIKIILEAFAGCSRLNINFGKSSNSPLHLSGSTSAKLAALLGCSSCDFPLNYLGLPLSPKALRKSDFLPIIEKVDKRLAGWKGLLLSRGGRLVVLNSVLSSIPSYFCSALLLPKWVLNSIKKIRRGFFWKGKILRSGFHCLAKWEHICRPKRSGGLGIRNIRIANSALLMKGLWNFHNSTTLPWVHLLALKHYYSRSPLSSQAPPTGSCPLWKGLLSTYSPFITSTSVSLGDDRITSFWNARWCGDSLLRNQLPNLHAISTHKHLSVHNWLIRFGTRLNLGFPLDLGTEALRELQVLRALVANLSLSNTNDSLSWRWSTSGSFSVKSAYSFLGFDGLVDCKILHLWRIKIPLNIKIFLWLAARNKLLTAVRLAKRGWRGPSICCLCCAGDEDLPHLFFNCIFARLLWGGLLHSWPLTLHLLLNCSGNLESRWRSARRTLRGRFKELLDLLIAASCWEIWNERNRRIFDNSVTSSACCAARVIISINLWREAYRV